MSPDSELARHSNPGHKSQPWTLKNGRSLGKHTSDLI